ncbi:MAG: hypothetical protein SPJ84_00580 [Fusobacterium gastrosuis]|uniref:hypothetical protein n=1 Tax=Fusobacterium gastrosuis TaxID=1755100 RepID=UPI002A921649|nr:hypothetical protein [Fusobacteriaceae bacterium]MDY5794306.1 hypothetical protein [Fusobacterium gastrosuis]
MDLIKSAIERKLKSSNVQSEKIQNLINAFRDLDTNVKLPTIPLHERGSIRWYIEKLD